MRLTEPVVSPGEGLLDRVLKVVLVCALLVGIDYAVTDSDYSRAVWDFVRHQGQTFSHSIDRMFSRFR